MDQLQSPTYIFFRDKTSFQFDVSLNSMSCNTLSSVWDKLCQTWCRLWLDPWDRPKNSLTKMSMYSVGFVLLCLRYGLRLNPSRAGWRERDKRITTDYARSYSLCLWKMWLQRRAVFSRSVTISVAMKNMGGELFHSMGTVSVIVTSSSPILSEGKTKTTLGASVGRIPMQ